MLLSSAESRGNALRSSSVDIAAEARAMFLSACLCCADAHSTDKGTLLWTALTIAIRHSRIRLISSIPPWIKALENPAFTWGVDAGSTVSGGGSVSVVRSALNEIGRGHV